MRRSPPRFCTIRSKIRCHDRGDQQALRPFDVARLVDGVTKLSKIEAQTENERAAENLRKFLLAMSDDIRVLLVKLADRLHNMRTLHHIANPEKRRRIAKETMDIYAPLAERIGMYEFMREMQRSPSAQLEPEAYESTITGLSQLKRGRRGQGRGHQLGAEAAARRTASRPMCRGARNIPIRSGARCRSATSASNS
jgi:hypothetical protein